MRDSYDIVLFGMISQHSGMNRGGVSVSVRRLANALTEAGTRVALITSQAACTDQLRENLHPAVNLLALTRLSRLRLTVSLAAFLLRHRPRALIAFDQRAGLIAVRARRLPGIPTPLFWSPRRAIAAHEGNVNVNETAKRRRIRDLQTIHAHCAGIIAISRGLAEELSAFAAIPAQAITTIHNPVIDTAFHHAARAPRPRQPVLPRGRKLIVASGRLVEQKDHATLLRAFQQVNTCLPAFLLILGEGPQRQPLETLTATLGLCDCVCLAGHVNNPLPYMRDADVFALSSRYEGFGNVLAEALALGTAVVSTDCPFGPAEILDNGRYGRLTPVGDHRAMADALLATLSEPPTKAHQRRGAQPYEAGRIAQRYRETVLEHGRARQPQPTAIPPRSARTKGPR